MRKLLNMIERQTPKGQLKIVAVWSAERSTAELAVTLGTTGFCSGLMERSKLPAAHKAAVASAPAERTHLVADASRGIYATLTAAEAAVLAADLAAVPVPAAVQINRQLASLEAEYLELRDEWSAATSRSDFAARIAIEAKLEAAQAAVETFAAAHPEAEGL